MQGPIQQRQPLQQRQIDVLNQLRDAINSTYGICTADGVSPTACGASPTAEPGRSKVPRSIPRINLGPCGRFARDFRERWNARFPEKINIVFILTLDGTSCHHVLVRLPDGSYYDGGNGVITAQALQQIYLHSCLDEMTEFDPLRLDRWSYGLGRRYPACPNYSDETTRGIIDHYLAQLPPMRPENEEPATTKIAQA
jgi:hypothetical protein